MITDINSLLSKIEEIGGIVFNDPYLLNIVAIRDISNPDSWNDHIIYFYWDDTGGFHYNEIMEATTDPGIDYLESPMNSKGCAMVCEGWHRKLWKLGTHKGYKALQQYSPVKVYRDNNKDQHPDRNESTIEEGMFGINLHHAGTNSNSPSPRVSTWSAGCIVIRRIDDWNDFIDIAQKCYDKGNQRYYSLALFDINDI